MEWENIYKKFKSSNITIKLICIHIFIYLICELGNFIFGNSLSRIVQQHFGLYSSTSFLISHPWAFFTNAFFHGDVRHLLFNSLLLFSTGKLFLSIFDEKSFLKFYLMGVLGASLSYLIGMYFLKEERILYGSSGAIFSLFFALIAYNPNMKLSVPFLGGLEIKYIGPILFFLSFSDRGANFSHLGGVMVGFLYMKSFKIGEDFLEEIFKLDFMKFFKRDKRKNINKILNKISKSGYESLSEKEKKTLFEKPKN